MKMAGVVESLRCLHDCLRKKDNISIAEGCVYNISSYFEEELSKNEIEAALAAVFEEENGILTSIKKAVSLKTYKNAVVQALSLLKYLLVTHQERMAPFVENMKNVCMMCISRSDTSVAEKEKAFESLHELLGSGSWSQSLNVNNIIQNLFEQILFKPQPKVLQKLFHVLGTISHFYPENMNAHADKLLRLYFYELDKQGQHYKEVSSAIVAGCLEGLAEFLHTFSQPIEDDLQCREKVYSYVKVYTSYKSERKVIQRAALKILHLHGILFRQLLYENYEWWHDELIINWLHAFNLDDRICGRNALLTFYEVISTAVQESTNEEHAKCVFKYFIDYFKRQLVSVGSAEKDKVYIIQGLGKFSQSCVKYMTKENIKSLLTLLIQQAQQTSTDLPIEQMNETTQKRLQTLPYYVESIATVILHLKCTEIEVSSLQPVAVILIHMYGITSSKFQPPIIQAMMSLMDGIASKQGLLFDDFINVVIYQSLIRSCSSSNYDKYVPLWCVMTDVHRSSNSQISLVMKQEVVNKIYDTMIRTIIHIIKKLDLKVFHKTDYLLMEQDDPNLGLEARNPHDFKIFINLVEFCTSFLLQTDCELFRKWVPSFAQCMIIESSKNPLVSGFYKLLTACFCTCESISYFPNQESSTLDNKSLHKLISKYLKKVHTNVKNFKGDLQIACLRTFLGVPVAFLPEILTNAIEIFQIAFKVGRSYLKLASESLTALDKWKEYLPPETLHPILEAVLPELEPFLRNKDVDTGIDKELEVLQISRQRRKRFSLNRKKLIEMPESELLTFQKYILKFLGPIDLNVTLSLLNSQNERTFTWGQTKKLKLKMPFKGMNVFIYIDSLLPNVVDLAVNCSERQTRIAACELLHALTIFMLGTSKHVGYAEMSELFEKMFLPLIQLGCDSDEVVSQLFNPLIFQLAHWYSSPFLLRSKNSEIFVNVLLDCISHPSDSALRDISARCLGEFVEWSIRQHTSHLLEKSSVNIEMIITRICMLCGHPSASKRLGGALAFNSVYRVLREDESIIDEWYLELLYFMVKNLGLLKPSAISGEETETEQAVEHVFRVLKERSLVFNKFSKRRRRPPELNGVLLNDAVVWLFYQCRNENRSCRYKCMEMVSELAPLVDGCNSFNSFVNKFVKTESLKKFLEIVERVTCESSDPCSLADSRTVLENSTTKVMQWLLLLQSALDCYIWLFKNCTIGPLLLSDLNSNIIHSIEVFLALCDQDQSVLDIALKQHVMSHWEYDQFLQAKNTVVLCVFDFVLTSFTFQDNKLVFPLISEKLFSSSFWNLISKSIFNSLLLGFDPRDDEEIVKLNYTSKNILYELQTNLEPSLLNELLRVLQSSFNDFITDLKKNLKQMLQSGEFPQDLKIAVLCILTVQESGLPLLEEKEFSEFQKWLLHVCFEAVAKISETQNTAVKLEPSAQNLGELLLRLVCLNEKQVSFLISLLLDCTWLNIEGTRSLQYGEHFQSTFKQSLLMPLLTFPESALKALLEESVINKSSRRALSLVEQLCQFTRENKKTSGKLCQKFHLSLLKHWQTIESWAMLNQDNIFFAILILKHLALCAEHTSGCLAMHSSGKWVLTLISGTSEGHEISQVQSKALDLLQFLIPSPVNFPDDLRSAFQNLCQRFPEDMSELRPGTLQHDTFVSVFSKLLTALQITGNLFLLERIIALSVRDDNYICEEKIQKAFPIFMGRLNCELQCKAIEVGYEVFMETGQYSPQIRMNCVQKFVVPLIKLSHEDTVVQFFTFHLQQMLDLFNKPTESTRIIQTEHNLVSRIGCWWMVEALFSLVPLERLVSSECPITKELKLKKGLVADLTEKAYKTRNESVSHHSMENSNVKILFRKMQCAAYTVLIVLITSSKKELKFFTGLLFKDDNKSLWDKIVDCTQNYSFPVCWEQIPRQRKHLVSIRQSTLKQVQYLATDTQILVNSTLAEDVTRFDLTTSIYQSPALSKNVSQNSFVEISLEDDIINKHECMDILCALLRHMAINNLYVVPLPGNPMPDFPSWMEQMRKSLIDSSKHPNIRIFLTKLIMNNVNIFKPFASFWLYPIMQIVLDGCLGYDINYMVMDVISMLVSWHDIAIPSSNESEKMLASEILQFLISNAPSQRRDVLKYNVEIIRTVVQMWKDCLYIPYQKLLEMLVVSTKDDSCKGEAGIHIASIFLANGMQPWNDMGKQSLFSSLVSFISPSNKLLCLSSEVVGMCLKHLNPNQQDDIVEENADIFALIKQKIYNLEKSTDKYLHCLHSIQRHYPPILDDFLKNALYHLPKVHGKFKVMCVEMICARVETLGDFAYSELETKGLFTLLQHGDTDMQLVVLFLIQKMLPQLTNDKQQLLINECVNLLSVKSPSCRLAVFKVLMWASDQGVLTDDGISALLKGLIDSDSDIQEIVFKFWNDEKHLPLIMPDRFVSLIQSMYSSQTEQHFLSYALNLLLDQEMFGPEYNSNIFQHPLTQCDFKQLRVLISERKQHSSLVPLFSQLPGTSRQTQYSTIPSQFQIKASHATLGFQPTMNASNQTSVSTISSTLKFTVGSGTLQSAQNTYSSRANENSEQERELSTFVKSNRLFKDTKDASRKFAFYGAKRAARLQHLQRERVAKREMNISLCRTYRIGDFPDIEIPYSSIYTPLRVLSKLNDSVAQQMMILVFSGIMAVLPEDKLNIILKTVTEAFMNIMQKTCGTPTLVGSIFEMILSCDKFITLNADVVSSVSQESGLLILGSLVLEKTLIDWKFQNEQISDKPVNEHNSWLQLAELYQDLEEWDVVHGIFHEELGCCEDAKLALEAESQDNWKAARDYYASATKSNDPDNLKDYYHESFYKCLSNLSDWEQLAQYVDLQVDGNWELLWSDPWNKQHLLPQLLVSKIQLIGLEDNSLFLRNLQFWLQDQIKAEYLEIHFAEELAVLCAIEHNFVKARVFVNNCYIQFLNDWINMNTIGFKQRATALRDIHRLSELQIYLDFACSTNVTKDLKQLESYWRESKPKPLSFLLDWDKKLVWRNQFIMWVKEKFPNSSQLWKHLEMEMQLAMVDAALAQNNFSIAKKYMKSSEKEQTNMPLKLKLQRDIGYSKCLWLRALQTADETTKLQNMIGACSSLLDRDPQNSEEWNDDWFLQLQACETMGMMAKGIWGILKLHPETLSNLDDHYRNQLLTWINSSNLKRETVMNAIEGCGSNYLHSAVNIAIQQTVQSKLQIDNVSSIVADAYFKVAEFYDVTRTNVSREIHFLEAILRAMKFGSKDAHYLFPRLLQNTYLEADWIEKFIAESAEIAEWLFLKWISQILACLDKPIGQALHQLIVRVAKAYPQAMTWPFHISRGKYNLSDIPEDILHNLDQLLLQDNLTETFLRAMSCLAQPEIILLHHVDQVLSAFKQGIFSEEVQRICDGLNNKIKQIRLCDPVQGSCFDALNEYYPQFEEALKLVFKKETRGLEILKQIKSRLEKKGREKSSKRVPLRKYSPWLSDFQMSPWGDYLELPGQYTGECRPVPQYHIRISGFLPEVRVISSMRLPIKLTIIGNNAKEYSYLVKYGEDLRQDQRIQQLFSVMNIIFSKDQPCVHRQINIITYQVIPLTSQLGIIEWIDDTKTLKDILEINLNEEDKESYKRAGDMYLEWLKLGSGPSENNINTMHCIAYGNYSQRETVEAYKKRVDLIPWNIFRRALFRISASQEEFFSRRQKFASNYATMCISHWVLGIGDRHLGNCLIRENDGSCVGIDFGCAFGCGIQFLPVPELMPFRMTPHIINLLQPFQCTGLLQGTMVHCMRALRNASQILLATMEVFVHEPSINWIELAQRNKDFQEESDKWLPQEKLLIAKKKLDGANPVLVGSEELKAGHKTSKYFNDYLKVLKGVHSLNIRARLNDTGLSPSEQVECLMDLATDSHVLGKTWIGWEPWI